MTKKTVGIVGARLLSHNIATNIQKYARPITFYEYTDNPHATPYQAMVLKYLDLYPRKTCG